MSLKVSQGCDGGITSAEKARTIAHSKNTNPSRANQRLSRSATWGVRDGLFITLSRAQESERSGVIPQAEAEGAVVESDNGSRARYLITSTLPVLMRRSQENARRCKQVADALHLQTIAVSSSHGCLQYWTATRYNFRPPFASISTCVSKHNLLALPLAFRYSTFSGSVVLRCVALLCCRAFTHLWTARQGLSESEWLNLRGNGSQPLPHALVILHVCP